MNIKFLRNFALASILALASAGAQAETYTLPDNKAVVSITIPDGWDRTELDNGVEATSPDKGVYIAAEMVATSNVETAIKEAIKYLTDNGVVLDQATMKKKDAKFGAFDAIDVQWEGKDEDGPTQVSVSVVIIAPEQTMFLTYWASPDAGKANAAALNSIAASILPVK